MHTITSIIICEYIKTDDGIICTCVLMSNWSEKPPSTITSRLSNARPHGTTCYLKSPDTGHLVSRSRLCPLSSLQSRQEDANTSSYRRSNYEWTKSGLLKCRN